MVSLLWARAPEFSAFHHVGFQQFGWLRFSFYSSACMGIFANTERVHVWSRAPRPPPKKKFAHRPPPPPRVNSPDIGGAPLPWRIWSVGSLGLTVYVLL